MCSLTNSRQSPSGRHLVGRPSVALLGTFPPTQCGLATFGAALATSMCDNERNLRVGVVEVVDDPRPSDPRVIHQIVRGDRASIVGGSRWINEFESVIIQHEFGIFGGRDGDEVLAIIDTVVVPIITVLHTVLATPSERQRTIVEALGARSALMVVMSNAARTRLLRTHCIDPQSVVVVPHGAHPNPSYPDDHSPFHRLAQHDRPTVLTWGLLGPGKGIEAGIDAMSRLRHLSPSPRYIIAGQTHPKVKQHDGERYRESLVERAAMNRVGHMVEFDDQYRDLDSLCGLIRCADVVLLPYETTDQVTSGVLIEAIASEKPVIATDFPHARELLRSGAGLVVGHDSPDELAHALELVLTDHLLAGAMAAEARRVSAPMMWPVVGRRYLELLKNLSTRAVALASPSARVA